MTGVTVTSERADLVNRAVCRQAIDQADPWA